jgi:hypothetical protein
MSNRAGLAESLRTSRRIDEAWHSTEADFRRASGELSRFEQEREEEDERLQRRHVEEVERLRAELEQLQGQNGRLKRDLAEAKASSDDVAADARQKLELLASKQDDNDRLADTVADLEQDRRDRDREVARQLENAERELRRLALRNEELQRQMDIQGEDRATLRDETKSLRDQLETERHRANEAEVRERQSQRNLEMTESRLATQRDADLTAAEIRARLSQLLASNQRLTALLYSTGQFDDFFQYNADSNGLAFIAPDGGQETDASNVTFSSQPDLPVTPQQEWRNWIPQDAWDLAQNFQSRHLAHVRDEVFQELLLLLNSVWKKRESRKIAALKRQHVHDMQGLRRSLQHSQRYEDVVAREKIGFLKTELKKAHTPAAQRLRGMEGKVVDATLASAETTGREFREMTVENGHLLTETKRLRESTMRASGGPGSHNSSSSLGGGEFGETGTFDTRRDDLLFMEGASWMAKKVVDLSDRMGEDVGALSVDMSRHAALDGGKTRAAERNAAALRKFSAQMERITGTHRDRVRLLLQKVLDAVDRA